MDTDTTNTEPKTPPISERTQAIINIIEEKFRHVQDVTAEVREIKRILQKNGAWKSALVRSIKQFVSLIDTPANGRKNGPE